MNINTKLKRYLHKIWNNGPKQLKPTSNWHLSTTIGLETRSAGYCAASKPTQSIHYQNRIWVFQDQEDDDYLDAVIANRRSIQLEWGHRHHNILRPQHIFVDRMPPFQSFKQLHSNYNNYKLS